jgi:hypothetical protein
VPVEIKVVSEDELRVRRKTVDQEISVEGNGVDQVFRLPCAQGSSGTCYCAASHIPSFAPADAESDGYENSILQAIGHSVGSAVSK